MKRYVAVLVAISISLVGLSAPVFAQVYKCDGVWTNIPCDGTLSASSSATPVPTVSTSAVATATVAPSVAIAPAPASSVNEPPYIERLGLYRKLKKENEDYERSKKQPLSFSELDEARVLCQDADTSFAQCQDKVNELRKQLAERNPADSVVISE